LGGPVPDLDTVKSLEVHKYEYSYHEYVCMYVYRNIHTNVFLFSNDYSEPIQSKVTGDNIYVSAYVSVHI
jgi:hypothetical protein